MRSRRKARESALQALYQCDTLNEWTDKSVELYFQIFRPEVCASGTELESAQQENLEFSRELINGVIEKMAFVDAQISSASTNWSITRMCRVDRNILRVAVYEIAFLDDIPVSVSINEAIEIAKAYGTADSPMFINGVLDNVAGVLKDHPELTAGVVSLPKKVAVNA